ncbi:hypothetical protein EUA98_15010 [Pengzhenrongella frigida]|uniref:SAF domain-containing protein n=1 Tax=Pengzhenrongella frigida TaxID=1259133 RepID=A0A4V1ZGY6_9MICO|nr:hypothetical protein EUA98_15010 [Cellulomonas sp. HLT2-17]
MVATWREPVSPVAVRLRRPTWRDPRLLAGVVMVAAAVALGAWVVSAAEANTPVYVARGTLTPGETVSGADLVVGRVRLGSAEAGHYLAATAAPPSGLVVLRTVAAGELVPLSALGEAAALDVRPVPVVVADAPSAGVVEGAQVDLWVTPELDGEVSAAPRQLAANLEVAEVARPAGAFAVGSRTTVHVLVPTGSLPEVLAALAADGTAWLVLVPGTGGPR